MLSAGAFAGCVSKIVTLPLDVTKKRMQVLFFGFVFVSKLADGAFGREHGAYTVLFSFFIVFPLLSLSFVLFSVSLLPSKRCLVFFFHLVPFPFVLLPVVFVLSCFLLVCK